MNNDTARESKHSEEELREIAKHVEVYRAVDTDHLILRPHDWEKFAGAEPLDAYTASMLRLGDVKGLRVLDAGCGDGWLTVILAKLGAKVSAFDLSPEAIEVAAARVAANGVADRADLRTASFYSLPFADHCFDVVIGQAILHHLRDKTAAATEIRRVLAPGGRAIFVECFGDSEFFERLRLVIPLASAAPEDADHWKDKISYDDIDVLREHFKVKVEEIHLLSRLDRVVSWRPVVRLLNRFDRAALRRVPFLRRFARSVLIELT